MPTRQIADNMGYTHLNDNIEATKMYIISTKSYKTVDKN